MKKLKQIKNLKILSLKEQRFIKASAYTSQSCGDGEIVDYEHSTPCYTACICTGRGVHCDPDIQ